MKRLLSALLFAATSSAPALAEIDRAAFVALSASVLQVEALRGQGGFGLGSGVVVGPERIVTNCHVTRDAREIRIVRGGVRWRVQAQAADVVHDLCVLRVPGLAAQPVRIGRANRLAIGQSVTALGYTGGIGLQNSAGEVHALHRMDGAVVVQSTNWFTSGASGGGLFDDELRLVGILTFRLRGGEAHYFAAPAEWLAPLLDERIEERPVEPLPAEAIAYWQRPLESQPEFLRAAVLERDGNWAALWPLATAWTRADETDPEPWYLLGVALDRLDRHPDAQQALECSLALAPGYVPARRRLARIDPRGSLRVTGANPADALTPCAPGAR